MRRTPEETALSLSDLEDGDVAGRVDVGAAAQLDRIMLIDIAAHAEDADFVAIFFAEQRQRAGGNGVVGGHQPGADNLVGADLGVHVGLDLGDLGRAQGLGVRKIEAQAVGRDQAALLGDVAAEAMAQRGVEQMGRAVVGADRGAAFGVDDLVEGIAELDAALDDLGGERVEAAERLRRVLNMRLRSH